MENLPREFAVEIEQQWYDPLALTKWMRSGRPVVPHTRRPPTPEQHREIARKAAAWAARQGIRSNQTIVAAASAGLRAGPGAGPSGSGQPRDIPRQTVPGSRLIVTARKAPPPPIHPFPDQENYGRPVYLRRRMPPSAAAAADARRYMYFKVVGPQTAFKWYRERWLMLPRARLTDTVLTAEPARVDVSMDMTDGGGGHWEQVVGMDMRSGRLIDRWSKRLPFGYFFSALRLRLPAIYEHVWRGIISG